MVKRKVGRPKGENNRGEGKPVRIDPDLYGKAQIVTMRRNRKIGEYVSELIAAQLNRDYAGVLSEMKGGP